MSRRGTPPPRYTIQKRQRGKRGAEAQRHRHRGTEGVPAAEARWLRVSNVYPFYLCRDRENRERTERQERQREQERQRDNKRDKRTERQK